MPITQIFDEADRKKNQTDGGVTVSSSDLQRRAAKNGKPIKCHVGGNTDEEGSGEAIIGDQKAEEGVHLSSPGWYSSLHSTGDF